MRLIIGNVQTPTNPLLRAASLLIGAVIFVAALFFGAVLLAFVIGIVVILWAVAMARIWWIRRKLKSGAGAAQFDANLGRSPFSQARSRNTAGSRVIEGEFTDVSESSHEERERHESR